MKPHVRSFFAGIGLLAAVACGQETERSGTPKASDAATAAAAGKPAERVDGVTISTHGSGKDWGTDVMVETMTDIRGSTGANWVATHPYAFIRNDGSIRWRGFDPDAPSEELINPIRQAHAAGMKIMIKPHIGYWGSKFSWRGAIEFGDDKAAEERFWKDYRAWILDVAKACASADAFVVGTELDKMLDTARWRALIAEVRKLTKAPLTYAANWTDYQRVEFWDALDTVGIQAYFPIADTTTSDRDILRAGWERRMAEMRSYSKAQNRKIVFTELGYSCAFCAPVEPWKAEMDGGDAEATQLACMSVALEAVRKEPVVVGSFLWKWFPGKPSWRHDFQVQDPDVLRVVGQVWKRAQ